MIFVGHKNPDTDAICAAIGAADLFDGTPARAGELNKETEFVLNHFNIEVPELVLNYENKEIGLVDHNQTTQLPEGAEKAKIKMIIDHHALQTSPITSDDPIEINIVPWGSTSTIIAHSYFNSNKQISKSIAGALLSAIISDTLALQSPTTTEKDKEILEKLCPIAEIDDYKAYAKEMFKAKSNINDLTAKEILNLDYKNFEFNGKKVGCGVAETVEPETLLARKDEFLQIMNAQKTENNLDFIFFAVVDILNSHSDMFIASEQEKELAEKVYGGNTSESILDIGNRISRKKTIIPPISEELTK